MRPFGVHRQRAEEAEILAAARPCQHPLTRIWCSTCLHGLEEPFRVHLQLLGVSLEEEKE